MCCTTRMPRAMKPIFDRLKVSPQIEGLQWPKVSIDSFIGGAAHEEEEKAKGEEEDYETMKENDFEPYHNDFEEVFAPTCPSTVGFIIRDPSDRPRQLYKKQVVKAKGKWIVDSDYSLKEDE
ncbi:hypothetical protein J1N35_010935 [Gossypium stocksii]|uniref:Uncharacterized protein n=1 Tax=Gossypium stocksii TaxID=47602 RepID=A0A9D3W1Z1_9ROSI|nr:hypothetical protein J1N35_010935 [Gossypium stocksii]